MRLGWGSSFGAFVRLAAATATLALVATVPALSGPLVPAGFFDSIPTAAAGSAEIEADFLSYNAASGVVTATGGVQLSYQGYKATGDEVLYSPKTGAVRLTGNVNVRDPAGNVYSADYVDVTGGMKAAVLRAMTIRTADGALITAGDANYSRALETVLTDTSYAPCGECIDDKGRRIGWKVRSARIVYDNQSKIIYLEQSRLELLGFPVAWLPWMALPDPSEYGLEGMQFPSFEYSEQIGGQLNLPYQFTLSNDTDLIVTPSLMSRQGIMLSAEIIQRFANGQMSAKASGLYQLDRSAFAGQVGDLDWRGAIQTSGRFTPAENWTAGWSYTLATDAAFLTDYKLSEDRNRVNEVYATYLSRDFYGDVRLQQFNLLGNYTQAEQDKQAMALPNARFETVQPLDDGFGQIEFSARLLGVYRGADQIAPSPAVPQYGFGVASQKTHLMVQASWQNQVIVPGGLAVTPYLGLRGDAAYYDGASALVAGPTSLLTATPIAALDVRFPMIGRDDWNNTHLLEPIAQLVYRGSDTTSVGITNDDAQSFVFEDTNLFSYNRFTGSDRQETGLRANIGARYQANFSDGSWLELMAGQSFHLAGANALSIADHAQTGNSTGLGNTNSYLVLGAKGSFMDGFTTGAKVQVDTTTPSVERVSASVRYDNEGYTAGTDYLYRAANPALGVAQDQHEVYGYVGIPVADYWRLTAGAGWDIATSNWLEATAGLNYDDGYLQFGAAATRTGPTHTSPNDTRFTGSFRLKAPTTKGIGLEF